MKKFNEYEAPVSTLMLMETTGVLASSFTFGNEASSIGEEDNYNPTWF